MLVPCTGIYLILASFHFLFHPAICQDVVNTLPPELENATINGLLLLSASPCSKSCGLGWRSEFYCKIDKEARVSDCKLTNTLCLVNQECGLIAKTTTVGATLTISCLDATIKSLGTSDFIFVWKIARGIVTTDKYLFKIFLLKNTKTPWMIIIKAIEEKHAGTYMCQVQNTKTMQVVKQVLIGVRVIPENLVQLNYFEVLSPEQKEEMQILQGNPVTKKKRKSFLEKVKALFSSANLATRVIASGLAIGGGLVLVFGAIFLCMSNK
ncbi:transmembrane protein 81 [Scyliorhinus canicula]|uniref:transmembrane protein 81 n=1 Tax=Scyliorhinus canicula TaxID=7830 RepID=UPI0018F31D8F|nr:transmembrane protein 81 [Scyliorhinus canicula]